MSTPIFVVDAFTDKVFRGNPAGVCTLQAPAEAEWMQAVAAEMNHAETAFLWPIDDETTSLRWFTPTVEVELCGHATLASAHVLSEIGFHGPFVFETRSGRLTVRKIGDWYEMDFPTEPVTEASLPFTPSFLPPAVFTGKNRMDWFVEVRSEEELVNLRPRMDAVAQLGMRALIVTARAEAGRSYDFVSRLFAPQSGIDEDPVTGSAHCALGDYWSRKIGRTELLGYQASKRGGFVRTVVNGERTLLIGAARTTLRGELLV